MKTKHLNSKVARWALALEEYNCEVIHRSGSNMRYVDALNRNPSVIVVETGVLIQIKNMQEIDEKLKIIKELIKINKSYGDYVLIRGDVLHRFIDG